MEVEVTSGLLGDINLPLAQITDRFGVLLRDVLPPEEVRANAARHPERVAYPVRAVHRALAFAIERPGTVVVGFGALALYGLPFFVEGQDTVLMDKNCREHQAAGADRPSIVRQTGAVGEVWDLKHSGWTLRASEPHAALVQVLKLLWREEVGWPAQTIEGLEPRTVRAIQLVDASRRHLGLDPARVLRAAKSQLNQRWICDVLANSSAYADSPKETELRLLLGDVIQKHGLTLQEQVVVRRGRKIVTTLDFAIKEPRIGVMYDGAHHGENRQWKKDAYINSMLIAEEWAPLRFTSVSLATAPAVVEEVVLKRLPVME